MPGGQPTVVKASRWQRDGLFGFLLVAFGTALARGLLGAHTSRGRFAVAIVIGGTLVLVVAGWTRLVRRGGHLEVSDDSITAVSGSGTVTHTLSRSDGGDLRYVAGAAGRFSYLALQQSHSGHVLPLHLYSKASVTPACEVHGWSFTD